MNDLKRFSVVKPTVDTPFRVDFDWWKEHDQNWRVYLMGCLCIDHQNSYANQAIDDFIDWVDPRTGEVQQVDGIQVVLINHCARQTDFINHFTTLVDSVFRALLANGNTPLTPLQLAEKTGRPAETILRTLTGTQVYQGLRPIHK
jgi:hypothetical protein